jgi:uncharacterized Zn finger protein (UPF0148 family)
MKTTLKCAICDGRKGLVLYHDNNDVICCHCQYEYEQEAERERKEYESEKINEVYERNKGLFL